MSRASRWLPLFRDFIKDLRISSKEIVSDDPRGAPLVLWDSQKRFMDEVGQGLDEGIRVFNCLKSRQLGITTVSLSIDVFWLAMHNNLWGALVTDTEKNRDVSRATIRQFINSFPDGYFGARFSIVKGGDNRQFMKFSNGSRLDFLVAGTKKKSTAWGEGVGYAFAHLMELASYGDAAGLASFVESFAQVNPARLFIFESTAKGFNHWQARWKDGLSKPTERSFFIGWWASATNRIPRTDPRWDRFGTYAASGEERELVRAVAQLYAHVITPEQLAWIRWKESDAGAELGMLQQNQPWCVAAGTRVGTTRGILKIEDVDPGDVTARGEVLHAGQTGTAALWKARTKLGYELCGTGNHPLITVSGDEVDLSDSLGASVQLSRPQFSRDIYTHRWIEGVLEFAVTITPDFARLIGIFMGDGSLSGNGSRSGYQFSICCDSKDRDIVDESHRLIRSLFGVNSQENSYRSIGDGGWTTVKVTSRLVYDTFKKLDLVTAETGRTQRRVHVPEFIWRSPAHVVKEFLSGLFEADGHVAKAQEIVVFASKHDKFVRDVQLLLLGFGITCRVFPVLSKITKNKDDKIFGSTRMELRASESVRFHQEIGFLSERKRSTAANRPTFKNPKLSAGKRRPITYADEVVAVEMTDRIEPVFNLTVGAPHWFDANGILTHNTSEQAFVLSGYSFFQSRQIGNDIKKLIDDETGFYVWYGYYYQYGNDFFSLTMRQIEDEAERDLVELKVWEEPVDAGRYVIGFDPAYGRNDHKDRSVISVWRCFADCIVQVAEYATAQADVKHAAWVCAHLAGAYNDCIVNLEIGGPGRMIMQEWEHLRGMLNAEMYAEKVRSRNWENALHQARWYLYSRPDSMGRGYAYNFETTMSTKGPLMFQYRGAYITKELVIRSRRLYEEMAIVVQDGAEIGAPESTAEDSKDDRVFAAALATRAWINWRRPEMIAAAQTYDAVMSVERGDMKPLAHGLNSIVARFFKTVDQHQAEQAEARREPKWLTDRGLA